jgi:hypothetical protein
VLSGLTVVKQADRQLCDLQIETDGYNSKKVAQQKRKLDSSAMSDNEQPALVKVNKVEIEQDVALKSASGVQRAPPAMWPQPQQNIISSQKTVVWAEPENEEEICSSQTEWELQKMGMRMVPISALTIFSKK